MRKGILLAALCAVAASGCTHAQLRRSTVGQSSIVADIYQQQVLDNLARFVRDPNALPFFAVPREGYTTVVDLAEANGGISWDATQFSDAMLGGRGSRQIQQNYELVPISDPRKLELIRCALQQAVSGYVSARTAGCPDCEKRFANFYTGDPNGTVPSPCESCLVTEGCESCNLAGMGVEVLPGSATVSAGDGTINSKCLSTCWFHVACSTCADKVKKRNPCCLVGEHCGTTVWVCPGVGSDELTKLTLAILDYATNEPAKPKPKQKRFVTIYRTATNLPATRETASYVLQGEISVDEGTDVLLKKIGVIDREALQKSIGANAVEASSADAAEAFAESLNMQSDTLRMLPEIGNQLDRQPVSQGGVYDEMPRRERSPEFSGYQGNLQREIQQYMLPSR